MTHEQRDDIRTASAQLLQDLPKVHGELRPWNLAARDTLGATAATVTEGSRARNVRSTMTDAAALAGVDAREALAPPPTALARTIHDAKGENLAAVLVVARDEDAVNWANSAWIDRPPMDTTEETRVAYVALTRAERLLVLAIPSGAADSVAVKLGAAGCGRPQAAVLAGAWQHAARHLTSRTSSVRRALSPAPRGRPGPRAVAALVRGLRPDALLLLPRRSSADTLVQRLAAQPLVIELGIERRGRLKARTLLPLSGSVRGWTKGLAMRHDATGTRTP